MKIIFAFPRVIVDSKCLTNLNPNQSHLLFHFINSLEHETTDSILKLLVIVVEVIVIISETSFENIDTNRVPTLALSFVQKSLILTLLITFFS